MARLQVCCCLIESVMFVPCCCSWCVFVAASVTDACVLCWHLGVVIARKLQVIFEKFNLMGKLYATVFDGGANLRTAKNELRRMHARQVACVALQLPVLYFTSCLAHLVNSACNGAVLLAKRETFLVSYHSCLCQ